MCSKPRKEEVVRTDNRRRKTNKLCFTMRFSFYLCLYSWCPVMEKTKSTLLWFFCLTLSEPVQVKATSHLCGPHADHFFCCTLCSLLLTWTLYHCLMTFVSFHSFSFHVCVIRWLCNFLCLLPALRAWTYCFSFCSHTPFQVTWISTVNMVLSLVFFHLDCLLAENPVHLYSS